MSALRAVVAFLLVTVALLMQVSVMSHLSWNGVVPNLCLLVVVGAALVRGPEFGAVLGFAAGVALDLAPPADHVAGRWALALVVVGWLVGRLRAQHGAEARPSAGSVVLTVAAASFVGSSVFAFTGMLLSDPAMGVRDTLVVIVTALVYDVVATPFVLPVVLGVVRRLETERSRATVRRETRLEPRPGAGVGR
jgi:rod shape-determining protein MreD